MIGLVIVVLSMFAMTGCSAQGAAASSAGSPGPVPLAVKLEEEKEAMGAQVKAMDFFQRAFPDLAPQAALLRTGFQGVVDAPLCGYPDSSASCDSFLQAELATCEPERLDAADKLGSRTATIAANAKTRGFDTKPDTADLVKLLDLEGDELISWRSRCRRIQQVAESAREERRQAMESQPSGWAVFLGALVQAAGAYEAARQQQLQQMNQQMMQTMPQTTRCNTLDTISGSITNCQTW